MALQQAAMVAILAVVFGLLVTERMRPDLVAVCTVLVLATSRILSPDEALDGLKSEPAVAIASVFVLAGGLRHTGLAETLAAWIGRLAGGGLSRMLGVLMSASAALSAFTHHVAITALLLPVTLSLAAARAIAPSQLLLPMAIGSSFGTTITTITPSFLVASALLRQAGRPGLGLFAVAPLGLVLAAAGTLYMLTIGRFLLPTRRGAEDPASRFRLEQYMTEVRVLPQSPLVGKTPLEVQSDETYGFKRVGGSSPGQRLQAGDVLQVEATPEDLVAPQEDRGLGLEPIMRFSDAEDDAANAQPAEDPDQRLVQAVVAPRSWLIQRTIGEIDFRQRYGALVVGLWRREPVPPARLAHTRLKEGDVLVLQASSAALARVSSDSGFLLLVPFQGEVRRPRKALLAGAVMLATIAVASTGLEPLSIAMLLGATMMVLLGCLTPRQAFRSIDAQMYLFIAGAIPLGSAMKKTGTADLLGATLSGLVGQWPQLAILFVLFLVVAGVVQFMGSDSATTALFGSTAIALGQALGQAPEAYIVTVAIAAITATLTPMAHHNLVIYRPGGYRFADYARLGAPLTLLTASIVAVLAPRLWSA